MAAQFERLNESLAPLEAQVAAGDGAGPGERAAEVASLHALARSVAHKLDAVRAAEPAHWDDAMAEMDRAWHAFRHAANYFQSRL
jgi:hypothetical protein